MRKLYGIASGLAFMVAGISQLTEQHWLTVGFFGFIGAVFLILMIVGDEP